MSSIGKLNNEINVLANQRTTLEKAKTVAREAQKYISFAKSSLISAETTFGLNYTGQRATNIKNEFENAKEKYNEAEKDIDTLVAKLDAGINKINAKISDKKAEISRIKAAERRAASKKTESTTQTEQTKSSSSAPSTRSDGNNISRISL